MLILLASLLMMSPYKPILYLNNTQNNFNFKLISLMLNGEFPLILQFVFLFVLPAFKRKVEKIFDELPHQNKKAKQAS